MGREIRRVPKGWIHPKKWYPFPPPGREGYAPLFDKPYGDAIDEWIRERALWVKGEHPDQATYNSTSTWEEWSGSAPQPEDYRPQWAVGEATCLQVYETVSEGTPVSPVFESKAELKAWLMSQGHSESSAEAFVNDGWAPSMVSAVGKDGQRVVAMGIDSLDLVGRDKP